MRTKSFSVKNGNGCAVLAFAQEDMVTTFMSGINPQIGQFLIEYLGEVFQRLPELIDNKKINTKIKKDFKTKTYKLLESFYEEFNNNLNDVHAHPVLKMVNSLPKDELAAMAEALVNLTAFKRKMTESIETVGGPIDVAVISKGDGLTWVKRKHYFPAELNQHFFANYYRGLENAPKK